MHVIKKSGTIYIIKFLQGGGLMKSIRAKIIGLILISVILCTLLITKAGMESTKTIIDHNSVQNMNLLCREQGLLLDNIFGRLEQSVDVIKYNALIEPEVFNLISNETKREAYLNKLKPILVSTAGSSPGAVATYIRFNPELAPSDSGLFYSKIEDSEEFEWLPPTDILAYDKHDAEHVGWYYTPVEKGEPIWMEPYYNKNNNIYMISYVEPIYQNGHLIGIVGMDIDFSDIVELIDEITLYENGYAYLADENGNIIYHPHSEMIQYMMSEEGAWEKNSKYLAGESSSSQLYDYSLNGQAKRMAFCTLRNNMRLIVTAPTKEIDAKLWELKGFIAIAVNVVIIISVVIAVLISGTMTRPLRSLTEAAKQVSAGDLNVTITNKSQDEIGVLSRVFQQMVDSMRVYLEHTSERAYIDSLTGVKNRNAYDERMDALMSQLKKEQNHDGFGIVVCDINNLKYINDHFGHDFGNSLIINSCKLICQVFMHSPVYRIGGDEFVVLLLKDDLKNVDSLMEDIYRRMKESMENKSPDEQLSIAVGVAIYDPEAGDDYRSVFKRADEDMYQRKIAMKKNM